MKNRFNKSDCNLRFLKCLEVFHIYITNIIIHYFPKNKGFLNIFPIKIHFISKI